MDTRSAMRELTSMIEAQEALVARPVDPYERVLEEERIDMLKKAYMLAWGLVGLMSLLVAYGAGYVSGSGDKSEPWTIFAPLGVGLLGLAGAFYLSNKLRNPGQEDLVLEAKDEVRQYLQKVTKYHPDPLWARVYGLLDQPRTPLGFWQDVLGHLSWLEGQARVLRDPLPEPVVVVEETTSIGAPPQGQGAPIPGGIASTPNPVQATKVETVTLSAEERVRADEALHLPKALPQP